LGGITGAIDGLRVLGHVEGQTANIDYRYADGDVAWLKPLAQELVALKPDVIFASAPAAVAALRNKFALNEEVFRVIFTRSPEPKPAK
jgi:putative ABC transport system substrate-binding protein